MSSLIVYYDEIGTKSGNRPYFEKRLVRNIREGCPSLRTASIRRLYGRIFIETSEDLDMAATSEHLARVAGISSFSLAQTVETSEEALNAAVDAIELPEEVRTFKVETRRSEKRFPLTSPEVNQRLGARLQARSGWEVNLSNPDFTFHVDISQQGTFIYSGKQKGLGGLPVGSNGKLVALMSGGLDSPVAAFKMFRRGCKVIFVHFHNYSADTRQVRDKVVALVAQLAKYQSTSKLYLVPFSTLQQALVTVVPPKARMVAYRRLMFQIAEEILEKEGAKGFITGDSVGQVASQTLENLNVIYDATSYPIFSPLIGDDKNTIITIARQIGTYDISIKPYDDCCTFLVAKHPETKMRLQEALRYEERFDNEKYCTEALKETEVLEIG
ncbi:MAG: tRNA 4-thiouridine(8) synthase ThiI [Planctomycetota bacterium]|nr:tRNA 4-thiouridine(8) synthase ThiI [Planctomycetota bacterium]